MNDMLLKTTALANVQVERRSTVDLLQYDHEFFIQFFLGDELTCPVPDFHIAAFHKMIDVTIRQFVCAIPRGHAKTTLAKLSCIWYLLFSDYRFVIYVSNTHTIAAPACQDIIAFMETENFKVVFGEIKWHIRRESDGIYKFELNGKLCILRAIGAGQQLRGINVDNARPDLGVIDDLEDNDNIATEQLFKKLKQWFYGPFKKCFNKFHYKLIHLGNMISSQCLLKEHVESSFWASMHFGCLLSNGQPLWPDLWSLEDLRADYLEYVENGMAEIWFAEMMNMPVALGGGVIRLDQIKYRTMPEEGTIDYGFITIDLAISEQTWAHKAAITVHGYFENAWQIVDGELIGDSRGKDPILLFEVVLSYMVKWNISVVGIESIAYQASLQYVFRYLLECRGILGVVIIPLTTTARKAQRIIGWASMIKSGEYFLNTNEVLATTQLLNYDPQSKKNDDDYIDCASYAPQMIDRYLPDIVNNQLNYQPVKCKSAYQISPV